MNQRKFLQVASATLRATGGKSCAGPHPTSPQDVKAVVQESVLSILGRQGYRVEAAERSRPSCRSSVRHIVLNLRERQIRITVGAAQRR